MDPGFTLKESDLDAREQGFGGESQHLESVCGSWVGRRSRGFLTPGWVWDAWDPGYPHPQRQASC
jgi:hypothetical protein